jgi:sugar-specific transcriptional regulator TrmB/DNA-binding CsgD family transcriptional regulator
MPAARRRVLSEVGVGGDAEDVYRALLVSPGATLADLRRRTGLGPSRLRNALGELERRAMVSRRSGVPARYQPGPPEVVVEALISSREHELDRVRLEIAELAALRRVAPEQQRVTELVEILTTREGYAERWTQLQMATHESLEVFVRPPFAQQRLDEHESLQAGLVARGVASRAIYDQDALRYPGMLDHIAHATAAGEQARVVSRLPMKVTLSDRRTALVPFVQMDPEAPIGAGLTVHESTLLDALIALFDAYWERATPIGREVESSPAVSGVDEANVLALLAAGLKDEAIAAELGVSTQTIRRRITAIERRLGVTTRFQAGLALGRQGWPEG